MYLKQHQQYLKEHQRKITSGILMSCVLTLPAMVRAADPQITTDNPSQQITPGTEAATAAPVQLKRVKVNAQRTPVQPPTTLASVIDGKTLEEERIYRFEELSQLVTGLDVDTVDVMDTTVTIRGIGDGGESGTNIGMPGSVGLFVDGVYLSRPGVISNDLLDIDSTRVLKGPQGAAYGFNTTGGAIDIRTRKPTFTPEYSLEQSFGQRGYLQSKLMASGPLSDHWAGRINLSRTERGGNVTNIENGHKLGGSTNNGVRGQLLYQPNDSFSLRITGDYSDSTQRPVSVLVSATDDFRTRAQQTGLKVVGGRQVAMDDENIIRVAQGGGSVEANWKLKSGYNLNSLSSLRYFRVLPSTADNWNIPLYRDSGADVRDRVWSQSFWLDSPKGNTFDYSVGVDYWGENLDTEANSRYYNDNRVRTWVGNGYQGINVQRFGTLDDTVYSVYGRGTWHAADKLDVIVGLRQTYEKKEGTFQRKNRATFDSGPLSQTNRLPSGSISLNWFAAPNVTPYVTLGYGEKSGGLNVSSGAARQLGIDSLYVDPEKTRSAELGVKTHWLQRKVEWNTALFWSVVEDFQNNAYDEATDTSYLINAGKFRSRGGETQLTLRPVDGLSISLAGTVLDASYLNFPNARCPAEISAVSCDMSGKRVFKSPTLSYNTRVRYQWDTPNNLQASVSGQWSWRSWAYGTLDDSESNRIPSYGVLNLSSGLSGKQGDNRWNVSLWVKNALDKNYYRSVRGSSATTGVIGEPRMVGISVGYDFKG
ncbi:TonB-dependent receptor [Pectobacterium quasiaquaticum]|uniref:TonB-dependent receptor n=1 Tax=Pectobacterium quasiaquaticum TaxID=2774015 RepID=UPI001877065F|nr:TonB-dependent receptor [Pectobacterium quasiaquaticum]URG52939.1 TonB-dependent receptor [Pectobacterium quasiaquaticum]